MTSPKPPVPPGADNPFAGADDLDALDMLNPVDDDRPEPAATSVVSLGDLTGTSHSADVERAIKAGVSIATTLIEPLPLEMRAALEFDGALPPVPINKSVLVVGRQEGVCDVLLPNDGVVSRQHAAIIWAKGDFYVEDLQSSNGTYVNEARVKVSRLQPGNKIRCGTYTIRLTIKK